MSETAHNVVGAWEVGDAKVKEDSLVTERKTKICVVELVAAMRINPTPGHDVEARTRHRHKQTETQTHT